MGTRAICLALAFAWAGCFGPNLPAVSCADEGLCPDGLICDPFDNMCRADPVSVPDIDATVTPDAPAIDGAPAPDAGIPFCDANDSTLLACFRFELDLIDESMYGNSGSGTVTYQTGVDGSAVELDGTNSVVIPESLSLDTTQITIEMWINDASVGTNNVLFENDNQYSLKVRNQKRVRWEQCTGTCNGFETNEVLTGGTWQHIAVIYGSGIRRIYVDAAEVQAGSFGSLLNTDGADGSVIGANDNGGDRYEGLIDSLRIWSVVRTPEQICEAAGMASCP